MTYYDYLPAATELLVALREAKILEGKQVSVERVKLDRSIDSKGPDEYEAVIKFKHNGCDITVTVGQFWMYPHEVCYFVNVHHANGNFMCQSGTNRKARALIDVGCALHFANVSGDPLQSED